jgi:hypothetical protein
MLTSSDKDSFSRNAQLHLVHLSVQDEVLLAKESLVEEVNIAFRIV